MRQVHARDDEALGWIVRTNDPAFADWAAFTEWLEEDSANADAYHRLAASEQVLLPLVAEAQALQDNEPPNAMEQRRPLRWAGGFAVAAGIAGFLSFQTFRSEEIVTRPGEQRTINLASGNELVLNGDTAITLAGPSQSNVRIDRGQAYFRLAGKDKLSVEAGDLELIDIGTEFEVSRDQGKTRVVVTEGAVLVDPDGAKLRLDAGRQLETADGATQLRSSPATMGAAGAWTRGQLIYVGQAVSAVAADLRRSTGLAFEADPAIGARRFTGTIDLADVRRSPAMLGPLLGVTVRPAGEGWVLGKD